MPILRISNSNSTQNGWSSWYLLADNGDSIQAVYNMDTCKINLTEYVDATATKAEVQAVWDKGLGNPATGEYNYELSIGKSNYGADRDVFIARGSTAASTRMFVRFPDYVKAVEVKTVANFTEQTT